MNEISILDLQNLRHLIGGCDTTHCKMQSYAQEATDPKIKQFFEKSAQSAMQTKQQLMQFLQEVFKMINEKLTACISYYNKQMNLLNGYIRKFPNNIIAKLHNVKSKPFFDGKDMTDNDIEDFKL